MAKKSRTPAPPRRVQAPGTRTTIQAPRVRTDARGGRRTLWIAIGVAAALVAAAAAGAFVLLGGGSSSTPQTLEAAGCTLRNVPVMMKNGQPWRDHLNQLPKGFRYSTFPPTSGPHFPVPAPFNFYDQPVEQFRLVHDLEHGGVVIQYGGGVSQQDVDALRTWWQKDPNGLVIAPLPALGSKVAMAAWSADVNLQTAEVSNQEGHLATCSGFDEKAFDAFANTYGFRGPEQYPRTALAPGQ